MMLNKFQTRFPFLARGLYVPGFVVAFAALSGSTATAEIVRITVENVGGVDATYVTPVFAGFHDGSFDLSNGGTATPGLEAVAELGDTSGLTDEFTTADASRVAITVGSAPIAPGETAFEDVTIDLTSNSRLTLATMLLPSSDFFLGNISTPAFDLSDLANGPLEFTLTTIYDAGTELNDFATSPGNPLLGLPPGNPVLSVPDNDPSIRAVGANLYDDFLNLPAGGFSPGVSQLRVNVAAIPEPSTFLAGCVASATLLVRRRRRR